MYGELLVTLTVGEKINFFVRLKVLYHAIFRVTKL